LRKNLKEARQKAGMTQQQMAAEKQMLREYFEQKLADLREREDEIIHEKDIMEAATNLVRLSGLELSAGDPVMKYINGRKAHCMGCLKIVAERKATMCRILELAYLSAVDRGNERTMN